LCNGIFAILIKKWVFSLKIAFILERIHYNSKRFSCTPKVANRMNKGELVDAVASKAEVTKKEADAVLSAAIDSIMEAVAAGDKVTLVGFGSFEPRQRAARDGRNPQTGKTIKIPATTVPAFSAGKQFKEMVAE
jgi:DNA-binding protein HU-beta